MTSILKRLSKDGHNVTYVTDKDNPLAVSVNAKLLHYRCSAYMKAGMNDANSNFVKLSDVSNPNVPKISRAHLSTLALMLSIRHIVHKHLETATVDAVVFHYPALVFHLALKPAQLLSIPVFVIYVAPAFPSVNLPWIFSGLLTDPSFKIYAKQYASRNESEHHLLLQNLSAWRKKDFLQTALLNHFHVLAAWDIHMTAPINSGISFKHVGSVLDKSKLTESRCSAKTMHINNTLYRFITSGRLWYCSLGSFTVDLLTVLPSLVQAARLHDLRILFHDTRKVVQTHPQLQVMVDTCPDLTVTSEYLSHEWIVPRAHCVLTTGSVCLANICYYFKKPMIFLPILNEQFFWAKNYKYFTGVPPIILSSPKPVAEQFKLALNLTLGKYSSRVSQYLATVSSSMQQVDGITNISNIVKATLPNQQILT